MVNAYSYLASKYYNLPIEQCDRTTKLGLSRTNTIKDLLNKVCNNGLKNLTLTEKYMWDGLCNILDKEHNIPLKHIIYMSY